MKKTIRLALLSATLGSSGFAAPFMAIGDGAELFLTGTLGIRADDNVLLSEANEQDDLIFDITPGIDLTFGKDAQVKGSLTLGINFSSYSDKSELNTELFNGAFRSNYDDGKLKMGFNLSYAEISQNTVDARPTDGKLTRHDLFTTGGNAEVEISQITSVGAGITFVHDKYKSRGFTDSDSLTVPLDVYYKWTPKVDLSFGYQFRDYQVDTGGSDSTDHFFNVGARGEFTPKLTGKFRVGVTNRDLDVGGDESTLGLDASFGYEISPKTSLNFGASNDYGTSPQGQQQRNTSINVSVNSKLTADWSANAGVSWRAIDYSTRTDDFTEITLGANYTVNANVTVIGGYAYRHNESKQAGGSFTANVFSIAANFRY